MGDDAIFGFAISLDMKLGLKGFARLQRKALLEFGARDRDIVPADRAVETDGDANGR